MVPLNFKGSWEMYFSCILRGVEKQVWLIHNYWLCQSRIYQEERERNFTEGLKMHMGGYLMKSLNRTVSKNIYIYIGNQPGKPKARLETLCKGVAKGKVESWSQGLLRYKLRSHETNSFLRSPCVLHSLHK